MAPRLRLSDNLTHKSRLGENRMPVSRTHKCIFIHIPKCAGTSIESALSMHGDIPDVGLRPYRNQKFDPEHLFGKGAQHFTLEEIRSYMNPGEFSDYFKFTFVRNPWDRFISACAWNVSRKKNKHEFSYSPLRKEDVIKEIFGIVKRKILKKNVQPHFLPQWIFICDVNGKISIDFIGRFENLNSDWEKVCEALSVDLPLETRMSSNHEHYSRYYNPITRLIVHFMYRKDIKLFGYKFRS